MITVNKKTWIIAVFLIIFVSGIILTAKAVSLKKTTVLLFCASWSANCRTASSTVKTTVNSYGDKADYVLLDVDNPTTPDISRQYDISVPTALPFIYILDKNGKILFKQKYKNETTSELIQKFDPLILNN